MKFYVKFGMRACILTVALLVTLSGCGSHLSTDENSSGSTPVINREPIAMSDNLFDFTVKIEGDVFKFPMKLEVFQSYGWSVEPDGYWEYHDNTDLSGVFPPGRRGEYFDFYRNGKQVTVNLANLSEEQREISIATVCGVLVTRAGDEYAEVELPKGITIGSTKDDVITAFEEPSEIYGSDVSCLEYFTKRDGMQDQDRNIRINIKEDETGKYAVDEIDVYSFVQIESDKISNAAQVSDKITDKEKNYKVPTELGNDILSFNVEIEGDLYRLPAPVSAFLENGWKFNDDDGGRPDVATTGKPFDILAAEQRESGFDLLKGEKSINVELFNYGDSNMAIEKCFVVKISFHRSGEIAFKLSGGITIGTPINEFLKLHGSLFEADIFDNWYSLPYNSAEEGICITVAADDDDFKDKISFIVIENQE